MTLQTITPKDRNLRRVSIYVPHHHTPINFCANVKQTMGEAGFEQWLALDRLLVQLWESHSVRLMVMSVGRGRERHDERDRVGSLLPEITRRGIIFSMASPLFTSGPLYLPSWEPDDL